MNETPRPQTTEQDARTLGAHAGRMGLAFALNPFTLGTTEAAHWASGWNAERAKAAHYANAMNKRDRERPQWERDAKTGARDPAIDYSRERNS